MGLQNISPNNFKKILTTSIFHWLELINAILNFHNVFVSKKIFTDFFNILIQKICKKLKVQRFYFRKIVGRFVKIPKTIYHFRRSYVVK